MWVLLALLALALLATPRGFFWCSCQDTVAVAGCACSRTPKTLTLTMSWTGGSVVCPCVYNATHGQWEFLGTVSYPATPPNGCPGGNCTLSVVLHCSSVNLSWYWGNSGSCSSTGAPCPCTIANGGIAPNNTFSNPQTIILTQSCTGGTFLATATWIVSNPGNSIPGYFFGIAAGGASKTVTLNVS